MSLDLSRDVVEAFLGVLEPSLPFEGCCPILLYSVDFP